MLPALFGAQPLRRCADENAGRWSRSGFDISYSRTRSAQVLQHVRSLFTGKQARRAKRCARVHATKRACMCGAMCVQAQTSKHRRFYTLTFRIRFTAASMHQLAYCFP